MLVCLIRFGAEKDSRPSFSSTRVLELRFTCFSPPEVQVPSRSSQQSPCKKCLHQRDSLHSIFPCLVSPSILAAASRSLLHGWGWALLSNIQARAFRHSGLHCFFSAR